MLAAFFFLLQISLAGPVTEWEVELPYLESHPDRDGFVFF